MKCTIDSKALSNFAPIQIGRNSTERPWTVHELCTNEAKEPVAILGSELFLSIGMALDLSGQALAFKNVVDEKFEGFLEDSMAFIEEGDSVS